MRVVFLPPAFKEWQKLGAVEQVRVLEKIDAYAADPSAFRNQVKKMQGIKAWRLRVGDYRVVFDEDGVVLQVLRVGHRREIYR